jgi:hypothetical protein
MSVALIVHHIFQDFPAEQTSKQHPTGTALYPL